MSSHVAAELQEQSLPELEDQLTEEGGEVEAQPVRYSVSSYGADYSVDMLVKRIATQAIYVPEFQRGFVWDVKEASRFIESLLLGLPVPGIFLTKEIDTGKLLVVDGQQRLSSLAFFYGGIWPSSKKEFALKDVQPEFEGKTYRTLPPPDRLRLDDAILHATVFKEDSPSPDERGVYEVFKRLNTGGRLLSSQEVRSALNHSGRIRTILSDLNHITAWRQIYGRAEPDVRMRDQELILRFLALLFEGGKYQSPMVNFLNGYMGQIKNPDFGTEAALRSAFEGAVGLIGETMGGAAFRPAGALNAAVFDSVMVATAERLRNGRVSNLDAFKQAYERLVGDPSFLDACGRGTASKDRVGKRLELARKAFEMVI